MYSCRVRWVYGPRIALVGGPLPLRAGLAVGLSCYILTRVRPRAPHPAGDSAGARTRARSRCRCVRWCLLRHEQEGPGIGRTEEDMAPARAAFAGYAADLDAAGVLTGTHVLQSAVAATTFTARNGTPLSRTARSPTPRNASAECS